MIHDEDLKNCVDYSEGQKKAAYRVLVELVNLFNEYRDDIRIVGGWVPELMFPNKDHVGSVDVDVLINHLTIEDKGYLTMARILEKNGYEEHPEKYFSYVKTVKIGGEEYLVDVDILAGIYGGTVFKKRSQHVSGIKALKATGGDFAFKFPPQQVKIEAARVDGAIDVATVNVVAVVPYLIMKTAAMGRGKAKDAYDVYFIIKNYLGGIDALAEEFRDVSDNREVRDMKEKLQGKFASENHAGPEDVVQFLDLVDEEEIELTKRDVFERVNALLRRI